MNKTFDYLDSSNPILEKFKTVAPGTFAHCTNVMNLCELVGKDLGLNTETLKVAALYHDIGKMVNPEFFSENITGENPHDLLEPHVSYQYLSRHIADAVLILIQQTDIVTEMPEVLNIISRHHGDSVLASLFNKCSDDIEDNYRYKSKKPECPYSAVLMIVDSVEAMARSLHSAGKLNTYEDKQGVVVSVLTRLDEDDQLDQLKMGEVKQIKKRLIRELDSNYHQRVTYEPPKEPAQEDNE